MWSMTFRLSRVLAVGCLLVGAVLPADAGRLECRPVNGLERISRSPGGGDANDRSLLPAVNADGCVIAFKSYASNLVDNDRNDKVDVFTFDRAAGSLTERAPLRPATGSSGNPNDNSFPPSLNAEGSLVAFASLANNLTPGDFNSDADVFVYDRPAQMTSILTLREEGELGGGAPDLPPSLSGDGRFLVFSASSEKIVDNDGNQANDVFAYDRDTQQTELISVATTGSSQGRPANRASNGGVISSDGCWVAFYSDANNVVPADRNDVRDVFLRNRCAGSTQRVSVASDGSEANAASQAAGFLPGISGDGQLVVFSSDASNLDAGDDNGVADVFLRDVANQTTRRLSVGTNGESGNAASQYPALSADGRFVVFQSAASNLVEGDNNGLVDVFVLKLETGEIRRIAGGEEPNGNSTAAQLNADGTIVVFQSDASNLAGADGNGTTDVFAASNSLAVPPPPPPTTVTRTPTMTPTRTLTSTPSVTLTPTPMTPTVEPTFTAMNTPTRTPTRTVTRTATARPTATQGPTDEDGCSCRVDPQSGEPTSSAPLAMALLPVAGWVLRSRGLRGAGRRS